MDKTSKTPETKKKTRDPHTGSGTVSYYEGGYGSRRHKCYTCDGSGRVYEGGYGNTRCPDC